MLTRRQSDSATGGVLTGSGSTKGTSSRRHATEFCNLIYDALTGLGQSIGRGGDAWKGRQPRQVHSLALDGGSIGSLPAGPSTRLPWASNQAVRQHVFAVRSRCWFRRSSSGCQKEHLDYPAYTGRSLGGARLRQLWDVSGPTRSAGSAPGSHAVLRMRTAAVLGWKHWGRINLPPHGLIPLTEALPLPVFAVLQINHLD